MSDDTSPGYLRVGLRDLETAQLALTGVLSQLQAALARDQENWDYHARQAYASAQAGWMESIRRQQLILRRLTDLLDSQSDT